MRFVLIAIGLLVLLIWGFDEIVLKPFGTGEIYPHYSSLRTDPSGSKALFESLAEQSGITVDRLYKSRQPLKQGEAMLVLGVDPLPFSAVKKETLDEYQALVHDGGRMIFAFVPVDTGHPDADQQALRQKWNLRISAPPASSDVIGNVVDLDAGPEWQELSHGAIERNFGAGSIVLAPYSFPLSNQGLRDARDARFIAQLIGPAHYIEFDENHFGIVESGSVVKLMRQYRLQGAIAMLAIVAALFLWRSASSFLPPRRVPSAAAVAGRESIEGLSALLHRGIAPKELLDACFAEWTKSARRDERTRRVEDEIARDGKTDPVGAYRAASRILMEKK